MTALPFCFPYSLGEHAVAPPRELRSRQRPRDPGGRCYELAARYFLDHHQTNGVAMVHGLIACKSGGKMKHAWITLPGDLVYDRGRFFHGAGYREILQPEVVKSWSGCTARDFFEWFCPAGPVGTGPCPELEAAGRGCP